MGDEVVAAARRRARRAGRRAAGAAGRRARRASTSAISATPPAASAAMPGGLGQLVHGRMQCTSAPRARTGAQPSLKIAWYSAWLLSVFSSPGTGATRTRIVTAAPSGGGSSSARLAVALACGAIWSIVSLSVIGSPLPPWMRTVTLTSNSSFSPPLVNLTANVESARVGELVRRAGLQRGVAVGDRVDVGAVQAGAGRLVRVAARRRPRAAGRAARRRRRAAASRARAGTASGAISWPPISFVVERRLDERHHARLVDHVGGEEDLHLAGDLLDRLVGRVALVAERGADPLRRCSPARRGATRARSAATAARRASRRGRRGASACVSCWSACTRKPEIAVCRSCGDSLPPSPSSWKNSVPTCAAGLAGDRRRPRGCSP